MPGRAPSELDRQEVEQLRARERAVPIAGFRDRQPRFEIAGEEPSDALGLVRQPLVEQAAGELESERLLVGRAADDGVDRLRGLQDATATS